MYIFDTFRKLKYLSKALFKIYKMFNLYATKEPFIIISYPALQFYILNRICNVCECGKNLLPMFLFEGSCLVSQIYLSLPSIGNFKVSIDKETSVKFYEDFITDFGVCLYWFKV